MPHDDDNPHVPPQKLSPEDPEARDEGPRLIPLRERRKQPRLLEPDRHYLDLADVMIRKPRKSQPIDKTGRT